MKEVIQDIQIEVDYIHINDNRRTSHDNPRVFIIRIYFNFLSFSTIFQYYFKILSYYVAAK